MSAPHVSVAGISPIVIAPDIPFAQIDRALATLGWTRRPDPYAPPPIIDGEPELAAWSRPGDDALVVYGFTPTIALRVLSLPGVPSASNLTIMRELAAVLPTIEDDDIRALLHSAKLESVLLGISAARERAAISLLAPISALASHADPTIAADARACAESLFRAAAAVGAEWIGKERAKHPGKSVLFMHAGDAETKRQVVRWLIHDPMAMGPDGMANASVIEALRTALDDADWEVRMSAMLAAGRLRAAPLRSAIQRLRIPGTAVGIDRNDVHALSAARLVVLACLEHTRERERITPDTFDAALARMPGMPATFARCVMGWPVDTVDRACLLMVALTTPVDDVDVGPDVLPAGVVVDAEGIVLGDTGIRLTWIPQRPHWLGDAPYEGTLGNPIRTVTPAHGYLISTHPLRAEQVRRYGVSPAHVSSGTAIGTLDDAHRWCASLATATGVALTLPTADQWEMAARGPDGRRFAWGNGRPEGLRTPHDAVSPWGLCNVVGETGEWTRASEDEQVSAICAARGAIRPADRRVPAVGALHAARVVVAALPA